MLLVAFPPSPWSSRAIFALKEAGLEGQYQVTEYISGVGELWLRFKLWDWAGKITVPIMFINGRALRSSSEIARWAASVSNNNNNNKLALGDLQLLERVERITETILGAGRHRACDAIVAARGFDDAMMPWPLRNLLPVSIKQKLTAVAMKTLQQKYQLVDWQKQKDQAFVDMRAGLLELREIIHAAEATGSLYLSQGHFTYVDIVVATGIPLSPLPACFRRMGTGLTRHMQEPELSEEFKDLVAWRNRLYVAREMQSML